jgi:hypothetical protein
MKCHVSLIMFAATCCATMTFAQPVPSGAAKTTGNYPSDVATVIDAQADALNQAKQAAADARDDKVRASLETAIKEMQKAQAALEVAKNSPEKLGPALTAEQQAYQALLKATPREYRISRQRGQQGQSGQSGQPNQRQMDQLDLKDEANRYETERQASAAPTQQQREQTETANRLKELAQRQQDLNDRLKELQTALQAAKTDQEREDIQRQLKRLRDEERQMLADVDQVRQRMEQSPNASADQRDQLDQTRSDVQRAAQEMERNSPSQALAAGTRAQQQMQNLRDDLRKQSSSQFSDQMRQMRNDARELAKQEDEIAQKLDSMQNGEHKLDTSADNKALSDQLAKQESALTNLLGNMRTLSEQSENAEPLLSQKLYDTLRHADQRRTDNLLDMGSQLAERGFLPQTSEVERTARTNINELRQGVESAAESVLGNETEALKYAQKELDDLTRQMEREIAGGGTNGTAGSARAGAAGQTNRLASGQFRSGRTNEMTGAAGAMGTNGVASTANVRSGDGGSQQAQYNSQRGQAAQQGSRDQQGNPQNGNQGQRASAQNQQPTQQGRDGQQGNAEAQNGEARNQEQQLASNNSQEQQNGSSQQQGQRQGQRQGQGRQQGQNNQQAQNQQPGQNGQQGQNAQQAQNGQAGGQQGQDNQDGQQNQAGQNGGRAGARDRLTQLARNLNNNGQQAGGDAYGGQNTGPITGGDYVNWADRMRDVEQALDPQDLRNQLTTVRERTSALRAQFRVNGRRPDDKYVREQIIEPMTQVRVWLQEEIARQQNANSLVPLDRDPVPDNYSELVRKYYEKLGSAQ